MAETYTGEVRNGMVVFDADAPAEGTKVRIEPLDLEMELADLSRKLLAPAGTAEDLPSDMAENHDHYLHGHPKR